MTFQCLKCKDSCCRKKIVALNHTDIKRLNNASNFYDFHGNIFDYVIFRPLEKGKEVHGNKFKGVLTLKQNNGECVFLKNNRCSIYHFRPLACRLYPYNPIFIEKTNSFDEYVTIDKTCPGIKNIKHFPFKDLSLQWRGERIEYDKKVNEWNQREDRNLVKFVEMLLNDA